jgi:Fe-S-cluster containining protein
MASERTEFGAARTECACRSCVANCRFVPGALIPADLHRIAEYLNESDLTRFAFDNLLASPGAIIYTMGGLIRIRTLVPARRADGACRFLTAEDRCLVHAVSPYSCAMFDHTQSREEADALSLRGLMEVARAWQRGDLYAQLWMMLYHAGRFAPSPIEARERMRAALAAEKCAGEDRSTSVRQ